MRNSYKIENKSRFAAILKLLLGLALIFPVQALSAQKPIPGINSPKLEIYYFHTNERCPIDQSIEDHTRRLMQSDYTKEIKDGVIKFRVLNTDDKSNATITGKFEINVQALYLVTFVNGKEMKNDLTEFAFSCAQNNPGKFISRMKAEINSAIK
jgi:hypothetical protein